MAKTPEQKAQQARVAKQLKASQDRVNMDRQRRNQQNARVARRILGRRSN